MIKRSQHPKHDLFLFLCCSEVTVKCEMYEYSFRDHPIRLMHFVFIYFFLLERNSSKPKKKKVVEIEAVFFLGPRANDHLRSDVSELKRAIHVCQID